MGDVISEVEINEIEEKVADIIEEAAEFADESPMPDPEKAFEDVFYQE